MLSKQKAKAKGQKNRDDHRDLVNMLMYLVEVLEDNSLLPNSFDLNALVHNTFPENKTNRKGQKPPNITDLLKVMASVIEDNHKLRAPSASTIPGIFNPHWKDARQEDVPHTIPYRGVKRSVAPVTNEEVEQYTTASVALRKQEEEEQEEEEEEDDKFADDVDEIELPLYSK